MKYILLLLTTLSINAFSQVENRTSENTEKKLVENINSEKFTDYAPSISADGKVMIFESNRNKGWKLFETKLDKTGAWGEPISIESINNFGRKSDLIAGPSISYDGNELYFFGFFMFQSESEDIYLSTRLKDGWSEPEALPFPINTDNYEGFPSISADGRTLFFIRINENKPELVDSNGNTEACFEIWKSDKGINDEWLEPVKLPSPINMGCERSPKIMADNKTLLFSSIRDGGKGLYDMYQASQLEDGSWGEPISLDFINTDENDLSPCISASGDLMYYFSSNSIYQVAIPPKYRQGKNMILEGFVKNISGTPLQATILIKNKVTNVVIAEIQNSETDGWYSLVLTKGINYSIEFASADYFSKNYEFDLLELAEYKEEHLDIDLSDEGVFHGIIYDGDLKTVEKGIVSINKLGDVATNQPGEMSEFNEKFTIGNTYQINIEALGFEKLSDTLFVTNNTPATIEKEYFLKPNKIKVDLEVIDLNNNARVKSKFNLKNKNRDESIEANNDKWVSLRDGDRYEVTITADGYFFNSFELDTKDLIKGEDGLFRTKKAIGLTQMQVNSSLILRGIRFDTNSAELTDDSKSELERIRDLLKANPTVEIEISAHTDDIGDVNYNLELSKKRSISVTDYLVENGIDINNLKPVGYGKSKPSVPNTNDENRALNRRVEMTILKI